MNGGTVFFVSACILAKYALAYIGTGATAPGIVNITGGNMDREEQNKTLQGRIWNLAPNAIATMDELLRDPNTPAPTKAQLIGYVLERTLGKPDATIRLTTGGGLMEESENRLIALAAEIRGIPVLFPESADDGDEDGGRAE